ncbi:hypothetical protein NDU88_002236 [Pleurodeles waltl]|uniref:Uncharacterized protein n=1 Tax=Pleurodeles waltl TaxID=8319 RepID=A0AAV7MN95_PLEWA|nr:hypothetical protein NDU88_002236 [Pleurodeles waltl]
MRTYDATLQRQSARVNVVTWETETQRAQKRAQHFIRHNISETKRSIKTSTLHISSCRWTCNQRAHARTTMKERDTSKFRKVKRYHRSPFVTEIKAILTVR